MIEFPVQHFLREFCLIIPLGGQLAVFAVYLAVAKLLLGWKWSAQRTGNSFPALPCRPLTPQVGHISVVTQGSRGSDEILLFFDPRIFGFVCVEAYAVGAILLEFQRFAMLLKRLR